MSMNSIFRLVLANGSKLSLRCNVCIDILGFLCRQTYNKPVIIASKKLMPFIVKTTKDAQRTGLIRGWGQVCDAKIETPACMVHTKSGHIAHLTWGVATQQLRNLPDQFICMIPLSSVIDSKASVVKSGYKDFARMPPEALTYLSVHDPSSESPTNSNGTKFASINTYMGRKQVDSSTLGNLLEVVNLDVCQPLFDHDTPPETGHKKCAKSVDRALRFYRDATNLTFKAAPVINLVGGYNKFERERCLLMMLDEQKTDVQLFSFEGFHNFGDLKNFEHWKSVYDLVEDTVSKLPTDKPRLFSGALNPKQIQKLVSLGMDLFDTSYSVVSADKGVMFQIGQDYADSGEFIEIDLNDPKFKDDFGVPFEGCRCYTCSKYTRAYLNHLRVTDELLAPILMIIHNLDEMCRMMKLLRESVIN